MALPTLHDLCVELLDYIVERFAVWDVELPERRVVSLGPPDEWITESGCDEQVSVHWSRLGSSTQPPVEGVPAPACDSSATVIAFVVEIVRCSPASSWVDETRIIPSAAQVTEAGRVTSIDAWVLHHSLRAGGAAIFGALSSQCDQHQLAEVVPFARGGIQGVGALLLASTDLSVRLPPT